MLATVFDRTLRSVSTFKNASFAIVLTPSRLADVA